jgi:selenocysteine-specific elongation factor
MHIVGTAGHVDHGKSALVTALTGHNPDRLLEEQQRGMTLDLGFAPLRFPDGVEAGIVDVPGHERFLHNMLAGAAGMELLLLVVAATEGPKPQTLEHLRILDLLNVRRAIIVLTKVDLVDGASRQIAAQLVRDAVSGTVAADAPMFEVSSMTGQGVSELAAAIHDALVALPPRRPQSPAYLPIDRVFALAGHGTIVTGTLMQGKISTGDTLVLQPSGLRARIKSLQVFGQRVPSASGGTRLAVNLPGIAVDQIGRGESLVSAREFVPQRDLLVDFTALESARPVLRRRMPVRVHIGSAEVLGHLRFTHGVPADNGAAPAQLLLWKPVVFYPGQRIIVRRMSPKDLLGGAIVRGAAVVDARETSPTATDGAPPDLGDAPTGAAEVFEVLVASGLTPVGNARIAARANLGQPVADAALAWLLEQGRIAIVHKPDEYVSSVAFDGAWATLERALRESHERAPWRLGLQTAAVARLLDVPDATASRLLHAWHDDGRVAVQAGVWHATGFTPSLTREQKAFFETALAVDSQAPYLPHSYTEVVKRAAKTSADIAEALDAMLAAGAFVRIGDDLYRHSQLEHAQAAITERLRESGSATMAQLRDVLGTSRKYALPLMEHFDSIGFTVRDGDLRRLRKVK